MHGPLGCWAARLSSGGTGVSKADSVPCWDKMRNTLTFLRVGERGSRMAKRLVSGICTQNEHRLSAPLSRMLLFLVKWDVELLSSCLSSAPAPLHYNNYPRSTEKTLFQRLNCKDDDFNAFFDEVGVAHRMSCLLKAVLFCLPLTCCPRSPSPPIFRRSSTLHYVVSLLIVRTGVAAGTDCQGPEFVLCHKMTGSTPTESQELFRRLLVWDGLFGIFPERACHAWLNVEVGRKGLPCLALPQLQA